MTPFKRKISISLSGRMEANPNYPMVVCNTVQAQLYAFFTNPRAQQSVVLLLCFRLFLFRLFPFPYLAWRGLGSGA